MFSNSICGGRRVWLILLCLANLDVSRGDVGLESIQANFKLLQEQIVQLSDFVRSNSESMNNKLETKISQLTAVMKTNAELTKQQVETKTSLLTNVVEKSHVSILSQITEQQEKLIQLSEMVDSNRQSINDLKNSNSEIKRLISCELLKQCPHYAQYDGADWIVIQQRVDNSLDFNRTWIEYRDGFGAIGSNTSFWWGLEKVYQLTKAGNHELLLEMKKGDEYRFARYSEFEIAGESDEYRLEKFGGYIGTAGDVTNRSSSAIPTGQRFSTKDSDNDNRASENCANWGGGGWWYNACGDALNEREGGFWSSWGNRLTYTRMLIRAKT